ncbi:MAG: YihY/virulence factor BrkB family protein [Propionibacteriaceae bacterium]|nr:YihY/virulence factor BrkB family protein [Propionibacteriaceae bacterium]
MQRPDPDADVKPDSLTEISRRSWRYLTGRTLREFLEDDCLDLAAGLTYYGVLAVFPALIAVISLLGVFGQGPQSVTTILDILQRIIPASGLEVIQPFLEKLTQTSGATLGLVLGVAGALWFVSAYVGAFGRCMNHIYDIREGRPIWKLLPLMGLVTVVLGVLCLCAVLLLILTGPVARAVGDVLGFGSTAVLMWNIVKWPVLVAIVFLVIAVLYSATPNVRQPRFRWLSPGAVLAILTWFAGSLLFGLYVSNFAHYDATYGSIAGVIVLLIWLWVTNIALLLGAELDAEVERARELQGGIRAERTVQLPPRDTRVSDKAAAKHKQDVTGGRKLRKDYSAKSNADR